MKAKYFDVLIVYSDAIATSASKAFEDKPFSRKSNRENYNETYAYMLEVCRKYHLEVAFTTSADIIGAGRCSSYWTFDKGTWLAVKKTGYSYLIFDKFSPLISKQRIRWNMLFSKPLVKPFTSQKLYTLFCDKQSTFDCLPDVAIPTVSIKTKTKEGFNEAIKKLRSLIQSHPRKTDFLDQFVIKDRFGAGGNNIYLAKTFNKRISKIFSVSKNVSFVFQPFVKFDKGYQFKNYAGATEIRLIYLRNKIVQTYIRVAGNQDFVCNHGQGGIWITNKDIPQEVLKAAKQILSKINNSNALFALDFIISNNGNVYLLEGNIKPGIDWYSAYPENERMNKTMIRIMVREFVQRINESYSYKQNKNYFTSLNPTVPIV